ncbi:WD repeat, SAM and U-box domain-containing protein 1-like [Hydractinia symbiolongicarpus]|uniref:WD repeat, SAM and U-box domain-containing protein 1-like n=1 Tax=Hydractinia symbiolongicarpus TaxID=13093 RepID=UPI0025507103|nr:WD repeat, SAM and U-box domain-containing protein 1-like [Hydractinia symbiolongicarpus]
MGEVVHTLIGHTNDVNCCAFSSNNKVLASASGDKTIRLWNVKDGSEIECSPLVGHSYSVITCAFSPFGSILATGSQDSTIILWNADTGELMKTLQGHKGTIKCCVFSPNSQYLLTASSDETLRVWNLKSYQIIRVFKGPDCSLNTCRFTPDDLYVVAGSVYGDIRIWDFSSGKCEDMFQAHDTGLCGVGITGCDFSPTFGAADSTFALGGGQSPCFLLATCGGDNLVKLWHVYTASAYSLKCNFEPTASLEGHLGHVYDCRFSADGRSLASCSSDKTVIIWDPIGKKLLSKLSGHSRYVSTVVFSPNGFYLATGSNDKTVQVWELNNVQPAVPVDCNNQPVQQEIKQQKLLRTWSIEDVCSWLHNIGLEQYVEIFRTNAIDGTELLQITDDMLMTGLGIGPLGHRNKILREVKSIRKSETEGNIPDEFLCPITRELMSDPVLVADGFTYERSSITAWIKSGKSTSPMTNRPMQHTNLIPNRSLKSAIMRYFGPAPLEFCV